MSQLSADNILAGTADGAVLYTGSFIGASAAHAMDWIHDPIIGQVLLMLIAALVGLGKQMLSARLERLHQAKGKANKEEIIAAVKVNTATIAEKIDDAANKQADKK